MCILTCARVTLRLSIGRSSASVEEFSTPILALLPSLSSECARVSGNGINFCARVKAGFDFCIFLLLYHVHIQYTYVCVCRSSQSVYIDTYTHTYAHSHVHIQYTYVCVCRSSQSVYIDTYTHTYAHRQCTYSHIKNTQNLCKC
jgi:hypothetical protein